MSPLRHITLLLIVVTVQSASAQQGGDVFADPQNLQVLNENTNPQELGKVMRGFAMGLGLRCESCHVGEAGQPLTSFDFASDEKVMKQKARVMLEMTQTINTRLVPALDAVEISDRIEVRCVTCHRGRPKPLLIEDVLDTGLRSDGAEATADMYRELREQYYGSHSFDFSETVLPMYSQSLSRSSQLEAAIRFSEMNLEYYPDSLYTVVTLAELYDRNGDKKNAISMYRRAIELNAAMAPRISPRIEALQAE